MESKALKIPYRKETENLITQYSKFWERIVAIKNQAFGPSYLRSFVFPYPNTLLLSIQPGYHKALESGTVFKEKPKFGDYVGELSYLLPRMLRSDDIADIFLRIAQGEKIDVHFVEQILTDYKEKDESIKRPEARGRRYKVLNDENGDKHIYFEIRRQTLNDSKNPPTDYLEMMSFLGFFEMTRFLFKLSIEKPELYKITEEERNKLLVLINKYLENSGKKIENDELNEFLNKFAQSQGGFYLETDMSEDKKDFFLPLQSLAETSPLYLTALYNDALAIKRKLLEGKFISSESEIDTVVLGNEFTFPLLIAVPLLNDRDLNYLRNSNEANLQGIPIRLLPESVKAEKLSDEQRNLYERFFYLQFLSRYKGEDQSLLTIKKRIFGEFEKMGVKQRLFEAEQVSLGDPVDFYDFSKLSQEYISNLVERSDLPEEYKETIFALWKKRKKFINFSYPLGDNTYGLIESLKNVFPNIKDIAFFGKVGATMQWDGENHLGARVGRVVLPDYVSSVNNFNPKEFIEKTKLYGIKIPVIDFDKIELIFQSEGVLLQTLSDIKKAQQAIINNPNIPYNDKVRLLIDMESWYLNLVCQKFNIEPTVAYYTSDNSGIPPFVPGEKGTILTSLGPRGSFSVLISGLIVLRNIS